MHYNQYYMGCDFYIYTALKILHNNGTELLKLSEEPVYLYGYNNDMDNFTIHPSKRKPKIDYMKPVCEDILIYKKGEDIIQPDIPKYMELIEEFIKYNNDDNYNTNNKILLDQCMFSHKMIGESLQCIDDINEIYIVELRAWRN
jgi:hypothetical protein